MVKLQSLYRCRLVRLTPYTCSPAIDDIVLCPDRSWERVHIAAIAQSLSALNFNFEQVVEGSIVTAGKNVESENLNVIIRAIN